MRAHRALGIHYAAVRLEQGHFIFQQPQSWMALSHLLPAPCLHGKIVLRRGPFHSRNDIAPLLAYRQHAGGAQQLRARFALEGAPQFIAAQNERHVGCIFEVSFPDHPAFAVGRTEIVRRPELLQPDNGRPPRRAMARNRAAYSSETGYCYIVGHPGLSLRSNMPLHKSERPGRVKHLVAAGNRFTSGMARLSERAPWSL